MKTIIKLVFLIMLINIHSVLLSQVYQSKLRRITCKMCENENWEIKETDFKVDALENVLLIYKKDGIQKYKIVKRYPSKEEENGLNLIWECIDSKGQLCELRFEKSNNETWDLQIRYEFIENLLSWD